MSEDKEPRVTKKDTDDQARDDAGRYLGRDSTNFKEPKEKESSLRWTDLLGIFGVLAFGISIYNWSTKEKPTNNIVYVKEMPKSELDNDAYQRSEPEPNSETVTPEEPPKKCNRSLVFDLETI